MHACKCVYSEQSWRKTETSLGARTYTQTDLRCVALEEEKKILRNEERRGEGQREREEEEQEQTRGVVCSPFSLHAPS